MISDQVESEEMKQGEEPRPDVQFGQMLVSDRIEEPWFKSILRGMRERSADSHLPPLEVTSRPVEGATMGGIQAVEEPWYKSLASSIRDIVRPQKLPPLEVTSQPVEVGTIWGAYGGGESRSATVSVLIHVGVVALLLFAFQSEHVKKAIKNVTDIYYVPPYHPKLPPAATKAGGGGGGGMHQPTPVSHGAAPKFAPKPFIPPTFAIPKPKLPTPPAINARAPQIVADNYGDPLSKIMPNSGGQGSDGMGSGKGGGLGSGDGNGFGPGSGGGTGGGVYAVGGEVSAPQIVLKVDPEYSEDARKAKFSGAVMLSLVVDEHGLPRDIKVVRPLGLGLDQKAIEAVQHWRFRPGMKGGHPVATQATIEVTFRLL